MSWIKEIFRLRETINRLSYRIRVMEYPHTIKVGDVVRIWSAGIGYYKEEYVVCEAKRDTEGFPLYSVYNINEGLVKDLLERELKLIKKQKDEDTKA